MRGSLARNGLLASAATSGWFYVAAILGILGFAVFHDTGTGHAYDRLKPGMTPTEVAALLGVPRSETKSGTRVVQVWRIPDGFTIEVEFSNGKLLSKERVAAARNGARKP